MRPRRRQVVIGAASVLAPCRAAWPQPTYERLRIGLLLNELPAEAIVALLKKPLAERGYEEGLHYTLDIRSAQGHKERLNALAGELVAAKVDLIVAPLNPEITAARRASSTVVPIVMMFAAAPVETGLVAGQSSTPCVLVVKDQSGRGMLSRCACHCGRTERAPTVPSWCMVGTRCSPQVPRDSSAI